ncbi:EscU/YscU/HrcU family type III secretion system export apparatus switch protein [Sphingomonas asaccharolytica]|uniref:EscU/YscU/HrcU family type III secretion system export apparatus switch protein n=1 Tax=Sphingomonas asaccharolytica TaxID=40681 RepID=UPI00082BCA9A|nr:flagellar type III secretion system protein FlhB [Sphingomonas asaccharolytica]
MAEYEGDKTEAPTAKRRKDAIDKGDVLKSREFATALIVLAGCGWIAMLGPQMVKACEGLMTASFRFGRADIEDWSPMRPLIQAGLGFAPTVGGLFLIAMIAAVLSQAALGSFRFNGTLLQPKFSRVNPASGLKRIFGPTGWIELGKSLLKVALLGSIGAWLMWKTAQPTLGLSTSSDVAGVVGNLGGTFVWILFTMAGGLVLIAGVDLPIQIIRLLGKLRMSKQEVRDENKETEGSPEAKQHLRQRQREMSRRSVRKAVATADVILTNPTHFSVALRYDRVNDNAPVVVAKGRGTTALAIRDVAGDEKIPILEYPMLARAVYYTSREGQEIRDDLYPAVATVLAFVFGLNQRAGTVPPAIDVPTTARFDENGVKL